MSSAALVPSNQRSIPLQGRNDLRVASVDYLGVNYRVVKDPVGLQYHRLQPEQYRVLELLDGQRSIEQIRDDLREDFPTVRLTLSDVQQLITDLHKKGLVHSDRPGQGATVVRERRKKKREKLFSVFRSLLYLRLPGWDPERSLQWMYPYLKWLFHPATVTCCVLFVLASWVLLAVQFEAFRSKLPEFQSFFGWPNLMYMWIVLGIAKIIHEFGHGLSCKHYGGECHEMGVMLLVFSPCLYCDVTDSWMLRNKWHRIIIAAAGMYIEVILSAIAIFVWWNTKSGMLHHLALNTFFVTTITTVIFNANPLMRFDGYYMMSDFLEIPNLRPKSDKLLRESFAWYCLGIESKPDPFMPETGKAWFVTYAIAAWLYRWVILFSISLFLYTVLKPYDLQSIGVTLLVISMSGIIFTMFKNVYQIITAPRIEPMSKPKIAFSLLVFSGLIYAALSIPIPWHVEAPFMIEPLDVAHVHTVTPGQMLTPDQLEEAANDPESGDYSVAQSQFLQAGEYSNRVKPGDYVEDGQVVAVLENVEKLDELRALRVKRDVQVKQVELQDALRDNPQRRVAEAQLASIDEEIKILEDQLKHRVIRAEATGTVIAPPRVPEPKADDTTRTELGRWYGTPLDDRNVNCFLDAETHLLSIAPGDEFEAVVYVDQGDRQDVDEGMEVELRIENIPDVIYVGNVGVMAPNGVDFAPEPLTTKYGGQMSTVTTDDGREKLVSTAYRATVSLTTDVDLMKSGMRGLARFSVDERTAGEWMWRWIKRNFHFRL